MKALAWLSVFSLLSPVGKVFNFDTCQLGQTPPGWSTGSESGATGWEIRKDRTAPTPPFVLAETPVDRGNSRPPLAILNDLSTRDGDISVRIKPISGRDGLAGGVVWRYRDENNYYVARANATENTVSVFKVENGRRISLFTDVKHPIPANSWSILKVSARGPRFQVFVDHRRVLQGRDNTFSNAGRVGLWAMNSSTVYFDDFRVYPK
ncbi:MAG TPA: hypothetical protein VHW09_21745 [Bryobacteraceae bacterium]|jgi:hypothetical protein|nr:hypothetical protein [Bryobacteraceae bacterium]